MKRGKVLIIINQNLEREKDMNTNEIMTGCHVLVRDGKDFVAGEVIRIDGQEQKVVVERTDGKVIEEDITEVCGVPITENLLKENDFIYRESENEKVGYVYHYFTCHTLVTITEQQREIKILIQKNNCAEHIVQKEVHFMHEIEVLCKLCGVDIYFTV